MGPADPNNKTIGSVLIHPGDELGGGDVIEIANILIHPKYHPFTFENDVALLKLKEVKSSVIFSIKFGFKREFGVNAYLKCQKVFHSKTSKIYSNFRKSVPVENCSRSVFRHQCHLAVKLQTILENW